MRPNTERAAVPPAGARLYLGAAFFGISFLLPAFIPLVTASDLPEEWKVALSGLLVVGIPQLFTLAAIVTLGKDGFRYMKDRIFAVFRRLGPPRDVGRTRYSVGLVMFIAPLLLAWVAPYAGHLIPGYLKHPKAFGIAGDLLLLAGLFVLGGEFWEKVRALFLHGAKVQMPPLPVGQRRMPREESRAC